MSQTVLPASREVVAEHVVVGSVLEEMELPRLGLWIMMVRIFVIHCKINLTLILLSQSASSLRFL